MRPNDAQSEFQDRLDRSGLDRDTLTPKSGIPAMLAFYREERAEGCPLEDDGDMLLFQWGTYNWGQGEWFDLNITRQLISGESGEDEDIWQLSLTFKYKPTSALRMLGSENRWCEKSEELPAFESYIQDSDAFQMVSDVRPDAVELVYECAD